MLNYISLFSGCGGFDKGFIDNNFNCLGAYDIDPVAVDVFNKNIGNHASIHDLSLGKLPVNFKENVDVVISGSPCQGFSTIGKRRVEDPRNKLLLVGGKIAIELKAKYFIAENVMGSLSGDHRVYWNELEQLMINNGYAVKFHKCDATKIGLPQLRKRILMISSLIGYDTNLSVPEIQPKNLNDIFSNIENLPNHNKEFIEKDSPDYHIANRIKPGQKLSNVRGGERSVHTWNIPEVYGVISQLQEAILLEIMSLRRKIRVRNFGDADPVKIATIVSKFNVDIKTDLEYLIKIGYLKLVEGDKIDISQTFNGKYRRLCYSRPSPTVDTRFGSPKHFLHPVENRAITVREAARIQGFPDDFIFHGNKQSQFRMIGNAVPPPLSNWLALQLKQKLTVIS